VKPAVSTLAPLLNRDEIAALIATATATPSAPTRLRQGRRSGDFITATAGSGTDLADLRPYQPGDDTRHIDWRASARSRQTMLRVWHAEQQSGFVVLLDRRAAMRFGSRKRLKVTQAARLALTELARASRAGHEVGALLLDQPGQWIPPAASAAGLTRLIAPITAPAPPCEPAPGGGWRGAASELLHRLDEDSEVVILSDFDDFGPADEKLLLTLGQRFRLRVTRIVDPLERQPRFPFPVTLRWDRQEWCVAAGDEKQLAEKQRAFGQWLENACIRAGAEYRSVATDEELP